MGQALVVAAALGPLWALSGLVRGVGGTEYLVLASSTSLSLLLAQLAVEAAKQHREVATKCALGLALSLVLLLPFGFWLKVRTHHASLASATYSVISLAVVVLVVALASRLRLRSTRAQGLALGATGFMLLGLAGLGLRPAMGGESAAALVTVLLDVAVGAFLVYAADSFRRTLPPALLQTKVTAPIALLLAAGCALGVISEMGTELLHTVPVLSGVVGLLS